MSEGISSNIQNFFIKKADDSVSVSGNKSAPKSEAEVEQSKTENEKELEAQVKEFLNKTKEEQDAKIAKDIKELQETKKASGEDKLEGSKEEFNELLQANYTVDQIKQLYRQEGVKPDKEVQAYIDKAEGKEILKDGKSEDEEGLNVNIGEAGVDTE